jgi:hypothetical protein
VSLDFSIVDLFADQTMAGPRAEADSAHQLGPFE